MILVASLNAAAISTAVGIPPERFKHEMFSVFQADPRYTALSRTLAAV